MVDRLWRSGLGGADRGDAQGLHQPPVGKAFNIEHARVMKREKLVDLIDPNHPFPDPNSREDAMMVVENLHHPPTPAGSRASRRGVRR